MVGTGSGGTASGSPFLSISKALGSVNKCVNLIGVIVEYTPPQRSRGTDYYCTIKIVDESHHTWGLSVNVFQESMDKLPRVVASGDIILLSKVTIKAYRGDVNAVFNKRFSAFALFEGKSGRNYAPYQISPKFKLSNQDKEFVAGLREWMNIIQLDTVSKNTVFLRQIKEGENYDILCKILCMYKVSEELVLLAWDGSDAPPLPIRERLEDDREYPLPLSLVPPSIFSFDIISRFPCVGTVISVHVKQAKERLNLQSEMVGRWVKFINLSFQTQAGLWQAVFGHSTRLCFVPDDDRFIVKCMRDYEDRKLSRYERMPFTSIPWPPSITETVNYKAPFCTLRDIVSHHKVTDKFHCVVRVVAMFPSNAQEVISDSGKYWIRFTLEDPTARIHAYLYDDDGKDFFDEHPDLDEFTRKRNRILGLAPDDISDDGFLRNPPWIRCCIKSYRFDKSRPRESRHYGIFGTRVLPVDI